MVLLCLEWTVQSASHRSASCIMRASVLVGVPDKRHLGEHGQGRHEWREPSLDGPPEGKREAGHQASHGDPTGKDVAKRHHQPHGTQRPLWKLLLEAVKIAREDDPRQRAVGVGQGSVAGPLPAGGRVKGLVMKPVDEPRPRA